METQLIQIRAHRFSVGSSPFLKRAFMETCLTLELPWPPSINHYWRHVGNRTLISRWGRTFRMDVIALVALRRIALMTCKLKVEIQLYPPDSRRRDIDNCFKSLLDALQHAGVYKDDSQIIHLEATKNSPVPGGKTIVRIQKVKS